jgi:putative membrane protein
MKKAVAYGTVVLALTAAPLLAQGSAGTPQQPATGGAQGQAGSSGGPAPRDRAPQEPAGGGQINKTPSDSRTPSDASSPDRTFVLEAAQGGMAEVELGKLAGEKAQSAEVKQFAQKLVQDHGRANDELKTLARTKNITVPSAPDSKHKATHDRLAKLSGAAFDRAYMQAMVEDHQKDVAAFRAESQNGKDPDVKAWAAKTLPTLEQHYQQAQQLNRSAVGTSGQAPASGSQGDRGATGSTGGSAPRAGGQSDDASGGSLTPPSGGPR